MPSCACGGSDYEYRCSNWPKTCDNYELSYYQSDKDDWDLHCPECQKANRPYFIEEFICSDCHGTGRSEYTPDY